MSPGHDPSGSTTASRPSGRIRKPHRKSQGGCCVCKVRRVKCDERRPSCSVCSRRGDRCEYPPQDQQAYQQIIWVQQQLPFSEFPYRTIEPATTPKFSALDMQLFHRFMTEDFPPLPVDNNHTWTVVVPLYAHQYDFLMHAILAFAATKMTAAECSGKANFHLIALQHRTLAVRGFSDAIATAQSTNTSPISRDSLLAACYALMIQSLSLADGLSDFLVLLRGCGLLIRRIVLQNEDTSWKLSGGKPVAQKIVERLSRNKMFPLDSALAEEMGLSLKRIQHFTSSKSQQAVHSCLTAIAENVIDNPVQAFKNVQDVWGLPSELSAAEFSPFQDPIEIITHILIAHWLATLLIFEPFYSAEMVPAKHWIQSTEFCSWIFRIKENVINQLGNCTSSASASTRSSDPQIWGNRFTAYDVLDSLTWPVKVASIFKGNQLPSTPEVGSSNKQEDGSLQAHKAPHQL